MKTSFGGSQLMIISHSRKFIFIKSRKTASHSIQVSLEKFCEADDVVLYANKDVKSGTKTKLHEHSSYHEVQEIVTSEVWKSYFKFAFVRNPWDLVVSRYYWNHGNKKEKTSVRDFRNWVVKYLQSEYLQDRPHLYTGGKSSELDFVGKFESLEKDYKVLCNLLKIKHYPLAKKHTGFRKERGFTSFYSHKEKDLVAEKFAIDIKLYNYQFS